MCRDHLRARTAPVVRARARSSISRSTFGRDLGGTDVRRSRSLVPRLHYYPLDPSTSVRFASGRQPSEGCDVRACRLKITNFRGIQSGTLLLPKHGVLIGDNNTGKTTILEALDLVLGVDRLNRQPAVDEHDFFRGKY